MKSSFKLLLIVLPTLVFTDLSGQIGVQYGSIDDELLSTVTPNNSEKKRSWSRTRMRITVVKSNAQLDTVRGYLYAAEQDHILISPNRDFPERHVRLNIEQIQDIRYSDKSGLIGLLGGSVAGFVVGLASHNDMVCAESRDIVGFLGSRSCIRQKPNPNSAFVSGLKGSALGTSVGLLIGLLGSSRIIRINQNLSLYNRNRLKRFSYMR